jgi:hypothetical protein
MNKFRGGDGGGGGDTLPDLTPSPIPSDPSSGRSVSDYPEGYLNYFSKRLGEISDQVKKRSQELYSRSLGGKGADHPNISSNVSIPNGLYREGNQTMWRGLPLPRVENLNGIDYYISLDKDKFINIIDSTNNNDFIDIINPISCNSVGLTPIPLNSKFGLIRNYRYWPEFVAPFDSVVTTRGVSGNMSIMHPSINSTSVDEDSLPSFGKSTPIPIPSFKDKMYSASPHNHPIRDSNFPGQSTVFSRTDPMTEIDLVDAWSTPGASTSQLPSGSTSQLPVASTSQLPGGSTSQLPGGSTSQLPGGSTYGLSSIDPDTTPKQSSLPLPRSEYDVPYKDPFGSDFDPFVS